MVYIPHMYMDVYMVNLGRGSYCFTHSSGDFIGYFGNRLPKKNIVGCWNMASQFMAMKKKRTW